MRKAEILTDPDVVKTNLIPNSHGPLQQQQQQDFLGAEANGSEHPAYRKWKLQLCVMYCFKVVQGLQRRGFVQVFRDASSVL